MSYAHIRNGAVVRYLTELPFTFSGVTHFRSLTAAQQAAYGIVPVVDVTPVYDPVLKRRAKQVPETFVLQDKVEIYYYLEDIPPLTPQEQALADRAALDAQENDSCIRDSTIMALINQTKAQWLAWAGDNFPTLTAAERTRLGTLFWVVAVGVRRFLRRNG